MNRSKSAGVEPANGSIKTSCLNLLATTYNGQPYCPNYPIYVVGHLKLLLCSISTKPKICDASQTLPES